MLRQMDRLLFGGGLREWWHRQKLQRRLDALAAGLDHRFVVHYDKNRRDPLAALCDKYGSDKGEVSAGGHPYPWPSHTYADFYSRLYGHCRHQVARVFECGLGTNNPDLLSSMGEHGRPGASLRVWRDYFPNADVYGADIDRDILFEEERIRTGYMDQLNPEAIAAYWASIGSGDFDLMIDDGLHTFEAGLCLFSHSISRLARHGIYTIEDVRLKDLFLYREYFATTDYAVDYVTLFRPNTRLRDNNMVVIRHPD